MTPPAAVGGGGIALVDFGTDTDGIDTCSVTKFSGLADGDVLVAWSHSGDDTNSPSTGDIVTNWTQQGLASSSASFPDRSAAVYTKVVTSAASEPAAWDFVWSGGAWGSSMVVAAFRGVDNTTPVDVVGTINAGVTASGGTYSVAGVTVVTDGALVLALLSTSNYTDTYTYASNSRSATLIGEASTVSTAGTYAAMLSFAADAGATGATTVNLTSTVRPCCTVHLALRPA